MSGAAMNWAMTRAAPRCTSPNQLLVLLRIAHHADQYGRGCYAAQQTIADETHLSRATVKRAIDDLKGLGLITPGDPARAAHIRADRRPEVWDVPMEPVAATTGHTDPSPATGGRSDPSPANVNELTGGQRIFPRGVTVTPKPVREEPVLHLSLPQRIVRDAAVVEERDEERFITWLTHRFNPQSPAWWRKVAASGDLAVHAETWRAQDVPPPPAAPSAGLPPWCGQCGGGGEAAKFNPKFRTSNGHPAGERCPRCHPDAQPSTKPRRNL